ncbi:MAG: ACT domain-containing protein [Deltaproteobacteria bacterium]|nr:ACT domain-containing protein [Deltaproteobacteria bacterium]
MKVEQISVFLENRPGGLEHVTKVLADADINIRALSLADTSDFGILRLIVNDIDLAEKALQSEGLTIKRSHVVAVEIPDRSGGMNSISRVLTENNINVEYAYAFVEKSGENAIIIFRFDDIDAGIAALLKNGFTVLPGEKLYRL